MEQSGRDSKFSENVKLEPSAFDVEERPSSGCSNNEEFAGFSTDIVTLLDDHISDVDDIDEDEDVKKIIKRRERRSSTRSQKKCETSKSGAHVLRRLKTDLTPQMFIDKSITESPKTNKSLTVLTRRSILSQSPVVKCSSDSLLKSSTSALSSNNKKKCSISLEKSDKEKQTSQRVNESTSNNAVPQLRSAEGEATVRSSVRNKRRKDDAQSSEYDTTKRRKTDNAVVSPKQSELCKESLPTNLRKRRSAYGNIGISTIAPSAKKRQSLAVVKPSRNVSEASSAKTNISNVADSSKPASLPSVVNSIKPGKISMKVKLTKEDDVSLNLSTSNITSGESNSKVSDKKRRSKPSLDQSISDTNKEKECKSDENLSGASNTSFLGLVAGSPKIIDVMNRKMQEVKQIVDQLDHMHKIIKDSPSGVLNVESMDTSSSPMLSLPRVLQEIDTTPKTVKHADMTKSVDLNPASPLKQQSTEKKQLRTRRSSSRSHKDSKEVRLDTPLLRKAAAPEGNVEVSTQQQNQSTQTTNPYQATAILHLPTRKIIPHKRLTDSGGAEGRGDPLYQRCVECLRNGVYNVTSCIFCDTCDVALCVVPCFRAYHCPVSRPRV